jgi:hypothetical protein
MPAEQTVSIAAKEGLTVGDAKTFLGSMPDDAPLHGTLSNGGRIRKLEVRKSATAPAADPVDRQRPEPGK